jgi:hypothetical protein
MSKTVKLYTYVNGETADGAQVNADIANLVTEHNKLDDEVNVRINNAITSSTEGRIIQIGSAFPTTPTAGLEFFHTTQQQHYIYDGAKWNNANDNASILIWMGV